MRILSKRVLVVGTTVAALLAAAPAVFWLSLTHQPGFYRDMVAVPHEKREAKARRFVSQSLQLRNDIANEPTWEAVFTDEEVNAWLAEDLVKSFADQLPPEVHEPRVMFELDRVTLAFELDQGPVRSVIWVVANPRVPEENVLELTFEKIRAGMVPVPADRVLDRLVAIARSHGIDVAWRRDGEFPVATFRYTPHAGRDDIKLERVQILKGALRLGGRSERGREVALPTLPTRQVLQSKFRRRNVQPLPPSVETARTSTSPTS
jgi:hypothetical protein